MTILYKIVYTVFNELSGIEMRKQPINFRFKRHTLSILMLLEKKLHTSKTNVVEKALEFYAEKKLKSAHPFMKHAGILAHEDADVMLSLIRKDRRNKNIKAKL